MKFKTVIGILLVALSIAGMYFWETEFRDKITLMPVMVAASDISAGKIIDADDVKELRISPDSVLLGSLSLSDFYLIDGTVSLYPISANQQLVQNYFTSSAILEPEPPVRPLGQRVYSLKSGWIFSDTDSICEDERVMIYSLPEKAYLGTYLITGIKENGDVEILSLLDEYFGIFDSVQLSSNKLLFVNEEAEE